MTKSIVCKLFFSLTVWVCLAFISGPAFAQRGGGGGFHGGGGFRGGGAGFRGGGFSGGYRSMPVQRGGGSFVRPGTRSIRPTFSNGTGRVMVARRPLGSPGARWGTFARRGNFGRFRDFDDFFFFRRPFFGCCGFVGFDFGLGAPLWWGPGWPGWYDAYGYGPPNSSSVPYDYGPIYNSPSSAPNSAGNSSAILLLYLKDGTMYSVRDCWLTDGKLHCTATDRSESVVELDAIDIQRTVDENAKRGVPFILKANPTRSTLPH